MARVCPRSTSCSTCPEVTQQNTPLSVEHAASSALPRSEEAKCAEGVKGHEPHGPQIDVRISERNFVQVPGDDLRNAKQSTKIALHRITGLRLETNPPRASAMPVCQSPCTLALPASALTGSKLAANGTR